MEPSGESTNRQEQIEMIFEQALNLPPAERAAFLDVACTADAAIRREVEELLEAFEASGPLDEIAQNLIGPLYSQAWTELVGGHRIGPYRLVRPLGYGGMGTVYLAERADADFEQRVALKLVRFGVASEALRQRFLRERQILARLEHPHIARFLDGGMADPLPGEPSGQPYLVMEYVEGRPITEHCDAQRLSITERLRLFKVVCQAVHYAHQHLVVHRDLKPSNILVTDDGYVKLLDFGVAKLLADQNDEALTRTGLRVMTPEYAAPEQVRGGPITTATDVYGLGVVLYELLTGHRPYHVGARSPSEVEHLICETEPPRPSTAVAQTYTVEHPDGETYTVTQDAVSRARQTQPERLQKRLAGDLDMIVLKALAKEPDRRYTSAEGLMEDVNRHLAGQPVHAQGATLPYRLRKFIERHRQGVAVAAVLVLSLAAGLAGTAWQAREATRQARLAEVERDRAEQVSAFLVALFEQADPVHAQGDTLTVYDLLADGTERVRTDLADQPEVRASMLSVLGRAYRNMAQYDRAQPLLEEAIALRRDGAEPMEAVESLLDLGMLHLDRGRFDAADSMLQEALQVHQQAGGADDLALADVREHLGGLAHHRGELDAAEEQYRAALAIRKAHHGEHERTVAVTLSNLAALMRHRQDVAMADSLYREALAILRAVHREPHLEVATTLNNLGVLYYRMADYEHAATYLREAVDIRRAVLGDEHPEVAKSVTNLAAILEKRGDLGEAERLYREGLALKRRTLGTEHPSVAYSLRNLGVLLTTQERYEEAEALLDEALAVSRAVRGDAHPDVARSQHNLAALYRARGDGAAAETRYRQALELRRELLGEDHPDVASSAGGLGVLVQELGRPAEAEPLLRQALGILEDQHPAGHLQIARAQAALGRCLTVLGRYEEAERYLMAGLQPHEAELGTADAQTQAVVQDLVALYDAWDQPAKAGPYRDVLASAGH